MFTIQFFENKSEKIKIGKTLEATDSYSGTLREQTSIINPQIMLNSSNFPKGNYCYIEVFDRYYFVKDITSFRNNLWVVDLKCDVLESFKDSIKSNKGILSRQENIFNLYLNDDRYTLLNDTFTLTKEIGNSWDIPSYIITTQ